MGGWGILDYGLNFAAASLRLAPARIRVVLEFLVVDEHRPPRDELRVLVPRERKRRGLRLGVRNGQVGRAWIRKEVPRGAWPYDGEIDLGYGAALRIAATVLTNDPVFGWFAYGGTLAGGGLDPRSHPPRRVAPAVLRGRRDAGRPNGRAGPPSRALRKFKIELDRDGFAAGRPIVTDRELKKISFDVENRTGDVHRTELRLSFPEKPTGLVYSDGKMPVAVKPTGNPDFPYLAVVRVGPSPVRVEIVHVRN